MKDTTLRLIFAGLLGLGGLLSGWTIILVGMFRALAVVDIVALCGVLATPAVTSAIGFFLGHQNGVKRTNGA